MSTSHTESKSDRVSRLTDALLNLRGRLIGKPRTAERKVLLDIIDEALSDEKEVS